jgi:hypothetical protein
MQIINVMFPKKTLKRLLKQSYDETKESLGGFLTRDWKLMKTQWFSSNRDDRNELIQEILEKLLNFI